MENNKKKSITVLGLLSLLLVIIGVSYAAFSYGKVGEKENTVSTSTISMTYTEGENKITIDNAMPTEDEVGKSLQNEGQIFDFTVSFNIVGKSAIAYEVVGHKDKASTLSDNEVRIYLEKSTDGSNYTSIYEPTGYIPITEDSDIGAKVGEMILDTGSVDESLIYYYRLRMWVSKEYELTEESKFFTLRINVYGKDSDLFTAKELNIDIEDTTMRLEEKIKPNVVILPDYTTDTVKILNDITLYARWNANNYKINFNANGGSVNPTSKDITYGSTYGTLPTPSKTGYTFSGWWTALSGGSQITENSTVNVEGITVYARWTANKYSVSFNANGGNAVSTVLTLMEYIYRIILKH